MDNECNWAGDPDCRTLIHVMLCPVCSTRWQHLAAAVEAEIPHHGPVMADGSFLWNADHDTVVRVETYDNAPTEEWDLPYTDN